MTTHSSATMRSETPHVTRTTRTNTIVNALKERARATLNDESIDAKTRAVLRQALETYDPWLARLVRQADAGDSSDTFDPSQTRETQTREAQTSETQTGDSNEVDSNAGKIEALAEIICRGSDDSAAALLVLMGTLQNSADPKVLANTAKHYAFTRCGELNLYDIVDAQIAVLEGELLNV